MWSLQHTRDLRIEDKSCVRVSLGIKVGPKPNASSSASATTRERDVRHRQVVLLPINKHPNIIVVIRLGNFNGALSHTHLQLAVDLLNSFDVAPRAQTVAPAHWDRIRTSAFLLQSLTSALEKKNVKGSDLQSPIVQQQ